MCIYRYIICIALVVGTGCSFTPYRLNYLQPRAPRYAAHEAVQTYTQKSRLNIVSYNIKYSRNIAAAIELLRTSAETVGADIICLQEMGAAGVKEIAHTLGYNYVYYPSSHDPHTKKDFGPATLTRFQILNDRKIFLPPRYDKKIHKIQRIATVATISANEKELIVISTHLGVFISPAERARQVKTILSAVNNENAPCIIAGDFNTFTARHRQAIEKELQKEDFSLASESVKWTYKNWYLLNKKSVYDFIFVRGGDPQSSGSIPDRTVSDHRPVWARVTFP